MRNFVKKQVSSLRRRESGFTLVELLVVVGIIVALGAVIVPNVLRFASEGDSGAQAAEKDAVQAAMDAMMADQNIIAVTALANPANSSSVWTALPVGAGAVALNTYLREDNTKFFYCWNASGLVNQQNAAAAACP